MQKGQIILLYCSLVAGVLRYYMRVLLGYSFSSFFPELDTYI